jgi:proline racemase
MQYEDITSGDYSCQGREGLKRGIVHEGIIGSMSKARIVELTNEGTYPAIVAEVTGSAHIMGLSQFNWLFIKSALSVLPSK